MAVCPLPVWVGVCSVRAVRRHANEHDAEEQFFLMRDEAVSINININIIARRERFVETLSADIVDEVFDRLRTIFSSVK